MSNAWQDPALLVRPIEMGWLFVTRGGQTWVRITMDVQQVPGEPTSITRQPLVWWRALWAPLMSNETTCPLMYTKDPRNPGPGAQIPGDGQTGQFLGPALGSRESPVIVLDAELGTGDGKRRLHIPGMPADLASEGMLTLRGQTVGMSLARAIAAGTLSEDALVGPRLIVWRHARPATAWRPAVPDAWADVRKVKLMLQTGRFPINVV